MQFFATILINVCYRLYGIVVSSKWKKENNPRHHLQELFSRRLKRGQCFRTPCLGWSEFTCSYWGPFREGMTEVDASISLEIPSMLLGVWDNPSFGQYEPTFHQNVKITEGVLKFEIPQEWLSMEDSEAKTDAQ